MIETFTAEVLVTHSQQAYEPELARLASSWFESEVTCVALNVSMSAETGHFLARGTFLPQPLPSRSRVETAARWLGLVRGPGQARYEAIGRSFVVGATVETQDFSGVLRNDDAGDRRARLVRTEGTPPQKVSSHKHLVLKRAGLWF